MLACLIVCDYTRFLVHRTMQEILNEDMFFADATTLKKIASVGKRNGRFIGSLELHK